MITQETQWATRRIMTLGEVNATMGRLQAVNSVELQDPLGGVRCKAGAVRLSSMQIDGPAGEFFLCRLWWHAFPQPIPGSQTRVDFGDLMTPDVMPTENFVLH